MTEFVWVGGRPALDLCNTMTPRGDLLASPDDVCAWLSSAGFDQPDRPCEHDLERVRALRDALRAAFIAHDAADVADIAAEWLTAAPGHLSIDKTSLRTNFCPDETSCACMLVPALVDAIDLARDEINRVRVCAAENCSMLYLDASRNGSRRWCSMDRCGSRAKAHAYYERKRGRGE